MSGFVALETATTKYIESRRARVDAFVRDHFDAKATLLRVRRTFVHDIWRHLFNFVFAIPSLAARKIGTWLEKLGWDQWARRLLELPLSLKPSAEARIETLILTELLGLGSPTDQAHAYAQAIFADPELRALAPLHPAVRRLASPEHFSERAAGPLFDFANSRWTIFQALSSAMLLLAARTIFGEAGFDVFAIGNKVAADRARHEKSSRFFLGEKAGDVFYGIFPPDPTPFQVFSSIAMLIVGSAAGAVVLSAVLEPVMLVAGVQKRQLMKLIDRLEKELIDGIRKDALSLGLVGLSPQPVELPPLPPSPLEPPTLPVELPKDTPKDGWLSRATGDFTLRMRQIETRYGRRRIAAVVAGALAVFVALAVFISDRLRYDPYREVRSLIDAEAYPTALSRLDDLGKVKGYQQHSDYWFWRGRALLGEQHWDQSAEAHKAALKRNPVHRTNGVLIADLVEAVAHSSQKAKAVLLAEIGPEAVSKIAERAEAKERADRWMLVETAEKLGGKDELDYEDIAELDLEQAQTCAEKKRAVQAIGDRKISGVTSELKRLEGQAEMKCLQEALKATLAALEK